MSQLGQQSLGKTAGVKGHTRSWRLTGATGSWVPYSRGLQEECLLSEGRATLIHLFYPICSNHCEKILISDSFLNLNKTDFLLLETEDVHMKRWKHFKPTV